jgi:dephospho-CoA kinase
MVHSIHPAEYFRTIKSSPGQVFIGITGGIGSGKSAVAAIIRDAGFTVLCADEIGRDLTNSHPEVKARINAEFGQMYLPDGTIDRERMASLVFGTTPSHAAALLRLNTIVHPLVWKTVAERVQSLFAAGEQYVFNETALLFESGAEAAYDVVVVVDAPNDVRIQRLAEGRNISPDEARRRIAAQMPAEQKKTRADYVISNHGSRENVREETQRFLKQIQMVVQGVSQSASQGVSQKL